MERRYLVAALAMIVTFAGFSHGFRSLQQFSQQRRQQGQTMSGPQCSALPSIVSRVFAKVKTGLHQSDPEEAQVLAEMNLPMAATPSESGGSRPRNRVKPRLRRLARPQCARRNAHTMKR